MNSTATLRRVTDELPHGPNLRLRIGAHVVDAGALRIVTRPELPRLTSKAVAVLIELVRDGGRTVTRDQLLDRVWTGRFPTPDVLTQAIKELRRAFADDSKPPQYIETIPKLGYRLIAPFAVLDENGDGARDDGPVAAETVEAAAPASETPPPATSSAPRLRWLVAAAASGALVVAIAIAGVRYGGGYAVVAPAAPEWKVGDSRALTSDPGAERRPHLSPDGTRVAYAAVDPDSGINRIVVRSIEPSKLVRISAGATGQEALPVWSPDGTSIAFERAIGNGCTIFVASSLGGNEREVGPCREHNVSYYDWTPEGAGLVTALSRSGNGALALARLDLDSGERQFLDYRRTDDDQDLEPHYSPDGRFIAFRRGIAPYSDLFVMPAAGGEVRQVTHIASRIRGHAWTRDGSALVFASNVAGSMALYVVDVDSGNMQPLGVSPAEYPSASHDADTIAYEIPRTQNRLTRVALGGGASQTLAPSTGSDYAAALSPGKDRLVFVSDRSGQFQIWLYDAGSDSATPLTDAADTPVFWPRWSADGRQVVAVQLTPSGRQLIEIDVATRRQRLLSRRDENVLFGGFGIEPDSYLFAVGASGRSDELMLVRHPAGKDESRQRIESGVAFAQVDAANRAIYYTTTAGDGLYRYDLDSGLRRFISPKVSSMTTNGWRVVDGRIWYLTGFEMNPVVLHELDPSSGEERVLGRIDAAVRDMNFSVTADRTAIVLSEIGTENTDVGLFTLTRASQAP